MPSRSASLRSISMLSRCSRKRMAMAWRCSSSSSGRSMLCIRVYDWPKKPIGSFMNSFTDGAAVPVTVTGILDSLALDHISARMQ